MEMLLFSCLVGAGLGIFSVLVSLPFEKAKKRKELKALDELMLA